MQDAKVSIVIPIYNVDQYLNRCISSVIGQTYANIDILLLNDGSTDNSESICRGFESNDNRVRYYYHENMGLARTRNRGIGLAEGEYITFLDSDDWVEPDFIEGLLSDMLDRNADIGLCDLKYVDEETGNSSIVRLRLLQKTSSAAKDKSVVNKSRLFACSKIFRKSLFTYYNVEFPDFAYEDICTPLLTVWANTISYTSRPLYHYVRNRPGSLSNAPEKIGDIGKGLIWLKDRLMKENMYDSFRSELKKIAIAQLRFAARRFGRTADDSVQTDLRKLTHIVEELFPDLRGIADRKYYVPDNSPILRLALDKCLPYSDQIVNSPEQADARLIIDDDVLIYDLAELIMEIL